MPDDLDSTEEEDNFPTAPFWMTTFSDMVTLLLVFFVLILSISSVEKKKFQEALSYFQNRTGVMNNNTLVPSEITPLAPSRSPKQAKVQQYEDFVAKLKAKNLADKVQIELTEQGLHVTITDSVMFRSGQARLIEPSRTILGLLSEVLTNEVQSVVVEGHTDNQPIHTSLYPSNWELSAARAASVIRFLQKQPHALSPDRYVAIGYGEHRPTTSNASLKGQANNRRVEILLSLEPWKNKTNPPLPLK